MGLLFMPATDHWYEKSLFSSAASDWERLALNSNQHIRYTFHTPCSSKNTNTCARDANLTPAHALNFQCQRFTTSMSPIHRRPLMREQKLEPILQSPHVRVLVALQLKSVRYNLHRPIAQRCILSSLEAQVEESRVLRVQAESIHRAFGIRLSVRGEPLF